MSTTYTLKLLVDDTAVKDLERRLGGIMGVKSGGGGSATGQTNSRSVIGNLVKLGTIAGATIGVLAILKKISSMVVDASPILQAMLQILDTSVLLILRPIGDFIGYILRPIMLTLLTKFALPFYKYFAPIAQKYGTRIGQLIELLFKWLTLVIPQEKNPLVGRFAGPNALTGASTRRRSIEGAGPGSLHDIAKTIVDVFAPKTANRIVPGFAINQIGKTGLPSPGQQPINPIIHLTVQAEATAEKILEAIEKKIPKSLQDLERKLFNP